MGYLNTLPFLFILFTLVVYGIGRYIVLKRKPRKIIFLKEIIYLLFIAYTECIFYFTIFSSINGVGSDRIAINLVPFRTIDNYVTFFMNGGVHSATINLIGNIVVFMPLGCFIVLMKRRTSFKKALMLGFLSSFVIEVLQLTFSMMKILSRSFDVDDLILNTFGVAIGYIFTKLAIQFITLVQSKLMRVVPNQKP